MTKRERDENRLPRLTAYATAEGYRLKMLQAFLKREHGVGIIRVFDDCIYAVSRIGPRERADEKVYNLPLLPGYGAGTRIRSGPSIKSPGGVSLLERMTLAEDLGYNDSYFPVEENGHGDHRHPGPSSHDPSEYILSASPPTLLDMESGLGVQLEQDPSGQLELIPESPERAEDQGDTSAIVDLSPEQDPQESEISIGTHMSPEHPGYLEHVPSQALSPDELGNTVPLPKSQPEVRVQDYGSISGDYQRPKYVHPQMRKRRQSGANLTGKVAEAVFFEYGVSVFFGFQEGEEKEIMEDCEGAGCWTRGQDADDWEIEELHYVVCPELFLQRMLIFSTIPKPSFRGSITTCSVSSNGPPGRRRANEKPSNPSRICSSCPLPMPWHSLPSFQSSRGSCRSLSRSQRPSPRSCRPPGIYSSAVARR